MSELLLAVVGPVVLLATLVFLIVRLRFFADEEVSGQAPFVMGAVIVIIAATWQTAKLSPSYAEWFMAAAYEWIDFVQLLLFLVGLAFLVVGLSLYSDFWQTKGEEIEIRDQKLSLLENLQRDARQPYQLLELMNISVKEILAYLPECAGAIFLVNRSRRQLVLSSSLGLTRQETALLEHYPFRRNVVSQAIDVGEPLMSGGFDLYDRSGDVIETRFRSCLVLPLVSGMDRVGAIVLLTERPQHFTRAEIRYLSPMAEWLAEKIKAARLTRELAMARSEVERRAKQQADLSSRVLSISDAFSGSEALAGFCRSLVGLFGCQSVQIIGLANGALELYGGSEPIEELSENYKTALIDALDRNKPLIINQEAIDEGGRSFIALSTLLFPIGNGGRLDALLLRRASGAFKVNESDLRTVEVFARLAAVILQQGDTARLDITRRKGFQRMLRLLRFDAESPIQDSPAFFIDHLADILPARSGAIAFAKQVNGSFKATHGCGFRETLLVDFHVLPGEGIIAQAAQTREPQLVFGRSKVDRVLEALEINNRETFYRIFGEKGPPTFLMVCPLTSLDRVTGVVACFVHDLAESEKGEWERLLTLTVGLYSLRLTIAELRRSLAPVEAGELDGDVIGSVINRLNNHFSAIVGNAGLAVARPDLSGEVKNQFESIITEAERAADYLKNSLGKMAGSPSAPTEAPADAKNLNEHLNDFLDRARISGNLFMIGGRPKEVELRLRPVAGIELPGQTIGALAGEAVNRFAALALEDEMITISTYRLGDHVYLDVSRHRKDLPGVERLAGFGEYMPAREAARLRPADTFLAHLEDRSCFYSFSRSGEDPAYLSFKFPVSEQPVAAQGINLSGRISILAIDDQTVILDLITAMSQSLGYDVKTASSAEVGLRLARQTAFDVILTDLAMPGMSGLELAARIREVRPGVPIILFTGWEVLINQEQLDAAGITKVLHKPFRIEQLTDILRSVAPRKSFS